MTIPESLPEDWELKTIAELGKIYSGSTPSTRVEAYWNGDIAWITPNDLSKLNTRFIETSERKITSQGLKDCSANLLPAKSLVISSRAPIGYLALPTTDFCTNQGCKSIVFDDDQEPDFHYYNFSFRIRQIREKGEGTTFAEISKTALGQIEFPVPKDKLTQARIAEVLAAVDHTIAQTEALITKYRRIKSGLMQDLLTRGIDENGRLRDPATHEFKDSPYGFIPVEWEIVKLKDVCFKIGVGIATSTTKHFVETGGVPLIRNQNIRGNGIVTDDLIMISNGFSELNYNKKLKENDILTVRTGYPGLSCVVTKHEEGWQTFTTLISRPNVELVHPHFLTLLLNSWIGKQQINNLQAGGAQQNLNAGELESLDVFLLSKSEQEKIFEAVSLVTEIIRKEDQTLMKLNKLKSGLMQDLLTGKVSVAPLLDGLGT